MREQLPRSIKGVKRGKGTLSLFLFLFYELFIDLIIQDLIIFYRFTMRSPKSPRIERQRVQGPNSYNLIAI